MPKVDPQEVHRDVEEDLELQEDMNNIGDYGTADPYWVKKFRELDRENMEIVQQDQRDECYWEDVMMEDAREDDRAAENQNMPDDYWEEMY